MPKIQLPYLLAIFCSLTVPIGLPIAVSLAEPPLPLESRQVMRELDLTDSQLVQIRSLGQKHQQEIKPLRSQLREKQKELQTMLADSTSPEQLRAKYAEIEQLRRQIAQRQFAQALAIREILTPTQRQRLAEIIRNRPRRPLGRQ
jgi:Spy/CpxP family protein refolding chaperone